MNTCTDCNNEAHTFRDDVYGDGKGAWYCDVCYASDYFPDELAVAACREGVEGTIRFIPDE